MKADKNQIFLLLSTVCFILLTRNAIILKFIEPIGYIIDIYSAFPFNFYLGFIFCYFAASLLILNGKKMIGVSILCLNHFEILLIPYMLGYYSMGRADDMSYIGEYLQIANTGHFAYWDIYPANHIIGSCIYIISGLEVNLTSFIVPILFSFIFIMGIYLFSRKMLPHPCIKSLVIVSSFILYLGIYNFLNAPHALFFAFIPLYLFVMYSYFSDKKYNVRFSIIFVLVTLLIPYTHPFIVFFLTVIFLFHLISKIPSISQLGILKMPSVNLVSFLILAVSFFSWLIYSEKLMGNLRRSYIGFINKVTEPVFLEAADKLNKVNFGFLEYVNFVSIFYGRYLFPTIFIIASFIFIHNNRNLLKNNIFMNYSCLIALYILFLFAQLILLINPFISHQPDRIMNLNFILYAQIPLFALSIYVLFLRKSKSIYSISLVCLILVSIWAFSFFGCLDSPRVSRANAALTYNEVEGMSWFYNLKDDNSIVVVPLSQINRFHDLFGKKDTKDSLKHFPDHFGYSNNSSSIKEGNLELDCHFYIVLFTIDELLYQEIPSYAKVGRYYKSDFIRLRDDTSIYKIYDSMNIEIFSSHLN
ncbi:hypothetical protein MSSIH_3702 [Methanosarcina siciliae HI350]|uniref:Glycosyltransferase RgtA/B/C/D-like domain-containing protein n=1 Tax=Methanosarcina siciliae HI350 TaxID=1434119 RepID=A0A0E3PII0_9EURY|nr:hypothetical protein [Methanosarcina siciliae]AKB34392.1 hypothetical protein MSSIH_3702 [Methanosarcina siciliae HI350]